MGPEFSSTNLDRAGHFGPFHGSNRRRSGKQLITLDLNHFGFRGRGGQRGGENATSMVVSWIAKTLGALTRVVIRRGSKPGPT